MGTDIVICVRRAPPNAYSDMRYEGANGAGVGVPVNVNIVNYKNFQAYVMAANIPCNM